MMKKRVYGILFAGLILSMLVLPSVSALNSQTDIGQIIEAVMNGVSDILEKSGLHTILGGKGTDPGEIFARLLVLILIIFVVYGLLDTIKLVDTAWINGVIGIIIGLLGIYFLPDGFVKTLALPSGAFAAALTLGIPFLLYSYIVEYKLSGDGKKIARMLAWVVFIGLIAFMLGYNISVVDGGWKSFYWVHVGIIALCGIAILLDGSVQKYIEGVRKKAFMGGVITGFKEYEFKKRVNNIAEASEYVTNIERALSNEMPDDKREQLTKRLKIAKDRLEELQREES